LYVLTIADLLFATALALLYFLTNSRLLPAGASLCFLFFLAMDNQVLDDGIEETEPNKYTCELQKQSRARTSACAHGNR
jgi:hypothetical protein